MHAVRNAMADTCSAEQRRIWPVTSEESRWWLGCGMSWFRSCGIEPHCRRPVAWLAAGLEGLDDEHAAATAGTRLREWLHRRRIDLDRLFGRRRCQSQEFARSRDRLGAVGAGEQAMVADAMESFGQHVDEEPADELAGVECHRRVAAGAFDPVVLDLERNAVLVDRDQAMVRDGDAVGVARQIGEHGLRTRERALGVDEPALLLERGEECREHLRVGEMRV